jgi:hypothetical protein
VIFGNFPAAFQHPVRISVAIQEGAAIFKIAEVSSVRSEKKHCANFKKYF